MSNDIAPTIIIPAIISSVNPVIIHAVDIYDPMNDAFEQALINEEMDDMEQEMDDMDDEQDQFLSDAEADSNALTSIGWGTDEDMGCFGGSDE